jgi:hypothetical protein
MGSDSVSEVARGHRYHPRPVDRVTEGRDRLRLDTRLAKRVVGGAGRDTEADKYQVSVVVAHSYSLASQLSDVNVGQEDITVARRVHEEHVLVNETQGLYVLGLDRYALACIRLEVHTHI